SGAVARRQSPHVRRASSLRKEWMLLMAGPEGTSPLLIPSSGTQLSSGAEMVVDEDRLQLRVGRSGVTVNDVEVHGTTVLHAGDLLVEGDLQYLVLPAPSPQSRKASPVLDHWTWMLRLEEERAATGASFAVLIGRSGAFGSDRLGEALAEF